MNKKLFVFNLKVFCALALLGGILCAFVFYNSPVVKKVIDGDTIVLRNGRVVRYIGMDTPEKGECYYEEAKKRNEELVLGKKVELVKDVSDKDKYGRLLRHVYADGIFVNWELVREGYAEAFSVEPNISLMESFWDAERIAIWEKIGIWKECI